MKVITEPKVAVVGYTVFVEHPEYKIPADGTDAEKLGSFAAKGCYDSYGETGRANVDNQTAILEHKHGSVLEHSHISLFIEGITRAASLELNRHRPFNISQRSTRYTKEEDAAIVLDPYYAQLYKECTKYNDRYDLINDFITESSHAVDEYKHQVEQLIKLNPNNLSGFDLRKWARGKARNILPHGLETRGTWTNNHRGLRWFIEARSNRHAEPEIRRLANTVLSVVAPYAPSYYSDFIPNEEVDGIMEWVPKHSKV